MTIREDNDRDKKEEYDLKLRELNNKRLNLEADLRSIKEQIEDLHIEEVLK